MAMPLIEVGDHGGSKDWKATATHPEPLENSCDPDSRCGTPYLNGQDG